MQRDADAPKVESPAIADTVKHYCGMCQDEIGEETPRWRVANTSFTASASCSTPPSAPTDGKKVTCPVCRTALTIDFSPESLEKCQSATNRLPKTRFRINQS